MSSFAAGSPGQLRIAPMRLELAAALGLLAGHALIEKTGRNPLVTSATDPEDVWNGGGLYTGFPAAAETLTVVSTSAADAAAGTGGRTLRIVGLAADLSLQFETITLNGTTPVVSSLSWLRVNRAYLATAGTGEVNAGDITIRHTTTAANLFAIVPAGFSQTQVANYTIPLGWRGSLVHWQAGCSNAQQTAQEGTFTLRTRERGSGVWRSRRQLVAATNANTADEDIQGGMRLDEGTDIMVRCVEVTGDMAVTAGFEIVLIDV